MHRPVMHDKQSLDGIECFSRRQCHALSAAGCAIASLCLELHDDCGIPKPPFRAKFDLLSEQCTNKTMPKWREVREHLLYSNYENAINDEEFHLLFDLKHCKKSDLPYWNYTELDLDKFMIRNASLNFVF